MRPIYGSRAVAGTGARSVLRSYAQADPAALWQAAAVTGAFE
jgi:hypothetical protein